MRTRRVTRYAMVSAVLLSSLFSGALMYRHTASTTAIVVDEDPERTAMDVAMQILMESAYTRRAAAIGAGGADHDDGMFAFDSGDAAAPVECAKLKNRKIITAEGEVSQGGRMEVNHAGYIFRYDDVIKYAHMVTIETVPLPFSDDSGRWTVGATSTPRYLMFAAWQAAPLAKLENGDVKMAVEGLPEQRIWFAVSRDGGRLWSAPGKVPIDAAGSLWSPVLHYDKRRDSLWLLYSESRLCRRPAPPNNWAPGGDIKAVKLSRIREWEPAGTESEVEEDTMSARKRKQGKPERHERAGIAVGKGVTGHWSQPQIIFAQPPWGVPRVIANKLTVTSDGEWVLPYWLERPDEETCTAMRPIDEGGEITQAGVLISSDHGGRWTAYGDVVDATGRARMLEPTVVEVPVAGAGYNALISSINHLDDTKGEPATATSDPAALLLADLAAELGLPGTGAGEMGMAIAERDSLGIAVSAAAGTEEGNAATAAAYRGTKLVMFMRTDSGCMFHAVSHTGGRNWSSAQPYPLLCPNSKFHVIQLTGDLARPPPPHSPPPPTLTGWKVPSWRSLTNERSPLSPPPPPLPPKSTAPPPSMVDQEVWVDPEDDKRARGGVTYRQTATEDKLRSTTDIGVGWAVTSGAVTGHLAIVFNDHKRGVTETGCRACRTHLHLAVSHDGGATWKLVGVLEDELTNGVRIHYPTVLQVGSQLSVAYTRFYLSSEMGLTIEDQGVKVVHLTFSQHDTELLSRLGKDTVTQRALEAMVDDFIADTSPTKLQRFAELRWPMLTAALAESFEIQSLGGANFLKKKVRLARYTKSKIREQLARLAGVNMTKDGGGDARRSTWRNQSERDGTRAGSVAAAPAKTSKEH